MHAYAGLAWSCGMNSKPIGSYGSFRFARRHTRHVAAIHAVAIHGGAIHAVHSVDGRPSGNDGRSLTSIGDRDTQSGQEREIKDT